MRPEDRFLFAAARQALLPEHAQRMQVLAAQPGFDWELVFAAAERGGVAPLVYRHITAVPALERRVPRAVLERYRLAAARNMFLKKERARLLTQLLRFFRERGIAVIILKGAAQDLLVYEEAWLTVSRDTDIILSQRKEALSERTVRQINTQLYQKHIEYDYFEHHDLNMNGMLKIDFASVWQDARPVDYHGEPALVLSPEDHLISLCVNSCRKRFFRLKSLLDIHEFLLRERAFDWQKFAARCRRFECGNVVYAALTVLNTTIAPDVPAPVMASLGVSPARAALIRATVRFMNRAWSLSTPRKGSVLRRLDLTLILPTVTYTPAQLRQKFRQIMDRRAGGQEPVTAQPIE